MYIMKDLGLYFLLSFKTRKSICAPRCVGNYWSLYHIYLTQCVQSSIRITDAPWKHAGVIYQSELPYLFPEPVLVQWHHFNFDENPMVGVRRSKKKVSNWIIDTGKTTALY